MQPHVERMLLEHADVTDKLINLRKYLKKEPDLPAVDLTLLKRQERAMTSYHGILSERIERADPILRVDTDTARRRLAVHELLAGENV